MKTTLFIKSIAGNDLEALRENGIYILVVCTCVLIAMIIDLVAGIKKAKQRGEICTSYGLRRTIDKSRRYFSLLMLCVLMDIIASLVIKMPYFTLVAGLFLVGVEVLSWFEKGDQKEKRNATLMIDLLKNKEDITKAVADAINQTINKKEDGNS